MRFSGERRRFVRLGMMAAGAGAVLPRAGARVLEGGAADAGRGGAAVRLGMCSYTFRSFDRAKMIGSLKELGVSTVNLKDVKDHLPSSSAAEEDGALADYKAAGITPTAVGTIYFPKDEDADVRAKFEYAKRAGVKVIVAGDPKPEVLPRIERFVKMYDIRLAIHNHGPEDKVWPSPLDVLKAVKGMDERMGCCVDVGHTMRAGVDPVEAIKAAGRRLHDVHMKDLAERKVKESQVAVGRGLMPVRAIFEALAAMKYPGNVDLEYEIHGDDPMPGVIESMAYMRGVMAGMGGPR
ncbi:MAG TPA: sugar phosphate isomerase/epimerase [Acidobacteriaceae bacterium]|nr:sugar phosphate isomerase/epimerase [Acidobacteriaceae bacterium]